MATAIWTEESVDLIPDTTAVMEMPAAPRPARSWGSLDRDLVGWLVRLLADPDLGAMGYVEDETGEVWDIPRTVLWLADAVSGAADADRGQVATTMAELAHFHRVMTETAVAWWTEEGAALASPANRAMFKLLA